MSIDGYVDGYTVNNEELSVASAGTSVTWSSFDGTDTATSRYLDLGKAIRRLVIRTDKVCVITHINDQVLKSPVTLLANTAFTITGGLRIVSFTIQTQADTTVLRVFATS